MLLRRSSRVLTSAAVAFAGLAFAADPAAAAPTVTVTPSTGLAVVHDVTVAASGFDANDLTGVAQCVAGGDLLGGGCGTVFVGGPSDATGAFTTVFTVHRFVRLDRSPEDPVDCASGPGVCSVVAGTARGARGEALLAFTPLPPPPPADAAALTVTPSDGIVDGSTVDLAGAHFTPGGPVTIEQCALGVAVCRRATFPMVYAGVDGAFALQPRVRNTFNGDDGSPARCDVDGPCVLRATDVTGVVRDTVPLGILVQGPRTLTVTPSRDLVDGQTVTVAGAGFDTESQAGVAQCTADASTTTDCDDVHTLTTNADGTFSTPLTVRRSISVASGTVDCGAAVGACVVAAASASDITATVTKVPISFAAVTPPAITSPDHAAATYRTPFSFTVTTTGVPVPALAISGGRLPAGASFVDNGDGTATIEGTPTAIGTYAVSLVASNGVSPEARQRLTIAVERAVPTTKAQCKHGGWRNYARPDGRPFRNQGSCVCWVARHHKHKHH